MCACTILWTINNNKSLSSENVSTILFYVNVIRSHIILKLTFLSNNTHFQIQNNQLNGGFRLNALIDRLILKRSHDNVDRVQRCDMFSLRLEGREVFNF